MYQKLTADTLGDARRILDEAAADVRAALLQRCLDSPPIPGQPAERPLRLAVFLAFGDLAFTDPVAARVLSSDYEACHTKLTAETARVALGVLGYARQAVTAAAACHAPGKGQEPYKGRALRASVHYSLTDLDRPGPLSIDDCLFLPYNGIPPGLQPRNLHPEYRIRDRRSEPRRPAPRPRRTMLQRLLGLD